MTLYQIADQYSQAISRGLESEEDAEALTPVLRLRGENDYAAAKDGLLIPDESQGPTGDDRSAEAQAHFEAIRR